MTLTLILTRHAKSSWATAGLQDYDRPLNDRGRQSAQRIGQWLAEHGQVPDAVVLSGAKRTIETWAGMAPAFPTAVPASQDRRLYHASSTEIMTVAREGSAQTLLLIGHNPGFADFAARLVADRPAHDRFADYPTAATTVISFDVASWADIAWGGGHILNFTVPRDLE